MMEYDIFGNGTIIDVSYPDFLLLLTQLTESCFSLANSFIVNHVSGLADFGNEFCKEEMDRAKRQSLLAFEGIKDEFLRQKLGELIQLVEELFVVDKKIINAYQTCLKEMG